MLCKCLRQKILRNGDFCMDEEKVRYFIEAERKKGTSTEELIFILYDNGVPVYEISNFLDVSIRHVEEVLSDD